MIKRPLVLGGAVVLVVAAGGIAWARSGSTSSSYRLALATTGTVTQTIPASGTVRSAQQSSVSFAVSGTVATVAVAVGQKVRAGQLLATLDSSALTQALSSDQADLATANQKLAADESGQATTTSAGGSGVGVESLAASALTATSPTSPPATHSGGGTTAGSATSLKAAQDAVVAAQKIADADLATGQMALRAATAACGSSTPTPTPSPSPTPSPTPTPSPSPSPTPSPTPSPSPTGTAAPTPPTTTSAACLAALQGVQNDQQATAKAQQNVQRAEAALEKVLSAQARTTTGTTPSGTSGGGQSTTGGTQSSGSTSSSGSAQRSSTSTTTATAADLAADQAQIDAATAQIAVAEADLASARLTSPLAGTIATVGLTAGSAASTSDAILVIGSGGQDVDTTVTLADLDLVKVGQHVDVTVDGRATPLAGTVGSIGLLSTTTGGTTTYPVVVSLGSGHALRDGAGATVSIVVGSASRVLTVPSSAVRTVGQRHIVTVVKGGQPSTVLVGVGLVGSDRTQITSGLSAGQQVELADLSTPLPTSSSTTTRGGLTGGGFANRPPGR